jgi:methylphosphotriester-DNA--protein-cysteine methyltransferase
VDYQEYPPHPALRPFIRTYWSLCGGTRDALPQPIFPDGTTELVVHRERPFIRYMAAGPSERQASTLFVGPMRSPVVLLPDSSAEVAAVRFRPNGAFALLGVPQHRLQDAITDVAALQIPWLRETVRASQEAASVEAAIAQLEAGLLARVDGGQARTDGRIDAVLAAIDSASGTCRIDGLTGVADTGRRHLERLFREQVGLTPKAYARVVRFTAAAVRVMEDPSSRLADVSSDAGYFDQSHMIRDFLSFAGHTPEEFRTLLGELTRVMLAGETAPRFSGASR